MNQQELILLIEIHMYVTGNTVLLEAPNPVRPFIVSFIGLPMTDTVFFEV